MSFKAESHVNHSAVEVFRGISYTDSVVVTAQLPDGGGQIIITPEKAREMAAELVRLADEIKPKTAASTGPKVGDKIRALKDHPAGYRNVNAGDVMTIERMGTRGSVHTDRLCNRGSSLRIWFTAERFTDGSIELVAPEAAIAVGDRVRIDHATYAEHTHGKIGTVTVVGSGTKLDGDIHPYEVQFTGDNGRPRTVCVRDLTKLGTEPETAPALAVGDKLRVLIGGQGSSFTETGDILTVVGVGSRFFSAKLPSGRVTELYRRRLTDGTVERLDAAKLETEARDLLAEFRTACERLGINLK